jgi:hypothetical protein
MSRTSWRATVGSAALVALLVATTLTIARPAQASSAFHPVAESFIAGADFGTSQGEDTR